MTTVDMHSSCFVYLDANGYGVASAGPTGHNEKWTITGSAASVSSNTNEASCIVHKAPVGFTPVPGTQIGTSALGSTGSTFGPGITLWPGQNIVAVWAGGDAGALATLMFWGEREFA